MIDLGARHAVAEGAAVVALHSLRLVPVAAFSPFLGGPLLPPVARLGLALALGTAACSVPSAPVLPGGPALAAAAVVELLLGALLAVGATLPFEAARAAGRLVDTLRGATLSELHVAPIRQQETAVGDLLVQWMLALAAWSGGDRMVMAAILESYRAWPVGAPRMLLDPATAIAAISQVLVAAIAIGAPAAAAVLVTEIALAATARLSPRGSFVDAAPALRAAAGLAAVIVASTAVSARLLEIATGPAWFLARLGAPSP